jgi:hypothetical protein
MVTGSLFIVVGGISLNNIQPGFCKEEAFIRTISLNPDNCLSGLGKSHFENQDIWCTFLPGSRIGQFSAGNFNRNIMNL